MRLAGLLMQDAGYRLAALAMQDSGCRMLDK
jgi:hypothetical protein